MRLGSFNSLIFDLDLTLNPGDILLIWMLGGDWWMLDGGFWVVVEYFSSLFFLRLYEYIAYIFIYPPKGASKEEPMVVQFFF